MALTPKQQRFVDEYLIDLNATQAAIRAGYAQKAAYATGAENLKKPQIAAAIAAKQAVRSERTEVTQDMVVAGLLTEARLDGEGSSHSARVQAWGLLARHLGMLTDKVKVTGEVTAVTEVMVRTREEADALLALEREKSRVK
jgi:phage terminase small subunit